MDSDHNGGGRGVEGEQSEPLGPRGSHMENLLMKLQFYTSFSFLLPKNVIEASIKHLII